MRIKAATAIKSLKKLAGSIERLEKVDQEAEDQAVNTVVGCLHIMVQSPTSDIRAWLGRQPRRKALKTPAKAIRTKQGRQAIGELIAFTLSELEANKPFWPTVDVGPLPFAEPKKLSAEHAARFQAGNRKRWDRARRMRDETYRQHGVEGGVCASGYQYTDLCTNGESRIGVTCSGDGTCDENDGQKETASQSIQQQEVRTNPASDPAYDPETPKLAIWPSGCINLREQFGERYMITHDPGYDAELDASDEPWLQQIPCEHGHLWPFGGDQLAVSVDKPSPIVDAIRQLNFVTVRQEGDDGINASFPLEHFAEMAAIIRPMLIADRPMELAVA